MNKVAVISMTAMTTNAKDILELEELFLKNDSSISGEFENLFKVDTEMLGINKNRLEGLSIQQLQVLNQVDNLFDYCGLDIADDKNISFYLGADTEGIIPSYNIENSVDQLKARILRDINFIHSFVSNHYDFRGESIGVQTACSSSLTSIHLACRSILHGDSNLAIAGGVSIKEGKNTLIKNVPGMIYSPSGICRPFDQNADGMVEGNGIGLVLLKKYDDAVKDGNEILAVITASAINSDGKNKMSFTSTSEKAQVQLLKKLLERTKYKKSDIDYVEAHGTGTQLGDYIELTALTKFFSGYKNELIIGSSKSQIGHCIHTAGVLGFIKTILQYQNNSIFGTPTFNKINRNYQPVKGFKINIPSANLGNRKIGPSIVASYGMGGMNAAIVLEQVNYNKKDIIREQKKEIPMFFPISCKNSSSINRYLKELLPIIKSINSNQIYSLSKWLFSQKDLKIKMLFKAKTKNELIEKIDNFLKDQFDDSCFSGNYSLCELKKEIENFDVPSLFIPISQKESNVIKFLLPNTIKNTDEVMLNEKDDDVSIQGIENKIINLFVEEFNISREEAIEKDFSELQIDSMELLEFLAILDKFIRNENGSNLNDLIFKEVTMSNNLLDFLEIIKKNHINKVDY